MIKIKMKLIKKYYVQTDKQTQKYKFYLFKIN